MASQRCTCSPDSFLRFAQYTNNVVGVAQVESDSNEYCIKHSNHKQYNMLGSCKRSKAHYMYNTL